MDADVVVEVRNLTKRYFRGPATVPALDGIDLTVRRGEVVAVLGPAGSGKTTLLHLLGGLDDPTAGTIEIGGVEIGRLGQDERATFRRRNLGLVFQHVNLLPSMAAWENVAVPRLLDGVPLADSRARAVELLHRMGLGALADRRPVELDGSQLQRAALARALVSDPLLVLADEPTGDLDPSAGAEVLAALNRHVAGPDRAVLVATHDPAVAATADRVIELAAGRVAAAAR